MVIVDIISIDKKRSKVICDEIIFALYNGEIRKYNLCVGDVIEEHVWKSILEDVLYKRAKEKSLYLLETMERTEYQICQKLKEGYYPIDIIERVIAFLKRYNYINDEVYAKKYIDTYINKKSIKCIEMDLYKKGIKRDIFESYLVRNEELEYEQISALLAKRKYNENKNNPKEKNKIISYIIRRGYSYESISKVISSM